MPASPTGLTANLTQETINAVAKLIVEALNSNTANDKAS